MTPLTEFSEINHFLGPKVAAIDPCLIEISHCAVPRPRACSWVVASRNPPLAFATGYLHYLHVVDEIPLVIALGVGAVEAETGQIVYALRKVIREVVAGA